MDLESGYPSWPVNDGLIATYPRLTSDLRCEVAILGGGITGALVAHHLVEAGIDTVILDRRDIGWGSTAASTALLQYELDVTLIDLARTYGADFASRAYLACVEAIGKLEAPARACSLDTGFERKKSLYLGTRKRDRKFLSEEHAARRAIGIRVDFLDEGAIAERFPRVRPLPHSRRERARRRRDAHVRRPVSRRGKTPGVRERIRDSRLISICARRRTIA